jgi:hypothetical protein
MCWKVLATSTGGGAPAALLQREGSAMAGPKGAMLRAPDGRQVELVPEGLPALLVVKQQHLAGAVLADGVADLHHLRRAVAPQGRRLLSSRAGRSTRSRSRLRRTPRSCTLAGVGRRGAQLHTARRRRGLRPGLSRACQLPAQGGPGGPRGLRRAPAAAPPCASPCPGLAGTCSCGRSPPPARSPSAHRSARRRS